MRAPVLAPHPQLEQRTDRLSRTANGGSTRSSTATTRQLAPSRSRPLCASGISSDMPVTVDLGLCIGAGECVKACAFNAVDVIDGKAVIYPNCTDCDACVRACPTHAIASATPSEAKRGGILVVDFAERSGISGPLAQIARAAGG